MNYMTTYIPNNLRALRKNVGLRQQDVAAKLGILGIDRISRWEKGLAFPSVPNLYKLAKLYDAPLSAIYPMEIFTLAG